MFVITSWIRKCLLIFRITVFLNIQPLLKMTKSHKQQVKFQGRFHNIFVFCEGYLEILFIDYLKMFRLESTPNSLQIIDQITPTAKAAVCKLGFLLGSRRYFSFFFHCFRYGSHWWRGAATLDEIQKRAIKIIEDPTIFKTHIHEYLQSNTDPIPKSLLIYKIQGSTAN